jgi:predicted protein tyrosine phosphatase
VIRSQKAFGKIKGLYIMFELKISNKREARQLSQEWATHTISLLSPSLIKDDNRKLPVAGKDSVLRRYYFDDINPNHVSNKSKKAATLEQIQDILGFTAPLTSTDKLLVHCAAGFSRSPAVACGVLCQHGLTPYEAVKYVLSIRPQAFPNQHVLRLFDDILGLEGQLVPASIELAWYKSGIRE